MTDPARQKILDARMAGKRELFLQIGREQDHSKRIDILMAAMDGAYENGLADAADLCGRVGAKMPEGMARQACLTMQYSLTDLVAANRQTLEEMSATPSFVWSDVK